MKINGLNSDILILTFTVVILAAINIHDVEAKMTLEQIRNMMKPYGKKCAQSTGVDKDILANSKEGQFVEDKALMCYELCLLKATKSVTKDNKLSMDAMIKQMEIMLDEELYGKIKPIVDSCAAKATSDEPCEMSWQFIKCYYETDITLTFFP